jgi:5-methylcytosine-specific restriction enzyme subunit McrC
VHQLAEYVPKLFPADAIPLELGTRLWQSYGENGVMRKGVVEVEFPTPATGGQWRVQSNGWVSYIPLSAAFGLRLQPKVGLANIFGMLEYAYKLQSFHFLEGLSTFDTLEDFYSSLADILARRTIDRAKKGLHHTYIPRSDRLTFVRGRMDFRQLVQKPWEAKIRATTKNTRRTSTTTKSCCGHSAKSQRAEPVILKSFPCAADFPCAAKHDIARTLHGASLY